MKTHLPSLTVLTGFSMIALVAMARRAAADSTVDPASAFSWSGNLGEFNWHPSAADGAVTGEYVCSGMVWSANAGWISLGSGSPANGIRYQNSDGADFGVNLLSDGSLRGLAWGANIGWVAFEPKGNPRIDLTTGVLSGFMWAANAGWLALEGGGGHSLSAASIASAQDTDDDGISDPWELESAGDLLTFDSNGDADSDGVSDATEYLAGSDPLDAEDSGISILDFTISEESATVTLEWSSRPSRRYHIESTDDPFSGLWTDSMLGEITPGIGLSTLRVLETPEASRRFYRIRPARPLDR